jgi:hypothetical protein
VRASFGPQSQECAALIDRAGRLTADEIERLNAAWFAVGDIVGDIVGDTSWNAARDAACDADRYAAWDAAWVAAWTAARAAAGDAAAALSIRDLIGQGRFTQAHYDLLTSPWRSVIGPLHADDAVLDGASC